MSENFSMEVCIYLVIKYNRKKETMFLLSLLFQLMKLTLTKFIEYYT